MSTSVASTPTQSQTDATWLRIVQVSLVLGGVAGVVLAVVGTLFTTIGGGDFKYSADYWYTAVGLPITLAGLGLTIGVHKLQHGADGRLGAIGVWVNAVAMVELFAQLLASVLAGSELRWGAAYPVFTIVSFVGISLLAAGSWRTGLLPKWMLGVWPLIWVLGSLAAVGPLPLLLAAFFVAFGITLTKRTRGRAV